MVSSRAKRRRHAGPKPAPEKKRRPFESPLVLNSALRGQRALEWLLNPTGIRTFFANHFEKSPLHLRHDPAHFVSLFSVDQFETLLNQGKCAYGRDLDVTSYTTDEGRSTHNGEYGAAAKREAWKNFQHERCSLRLLRPQQFSDPLWSLCALLEAYLQCAVGANVYLTPASTQGFAPHFDDIDAFVCQIHGEKQWKVYQPMQSGHDVLPRASSVDFTAEEMRRRPVALDVTLKPGDMLYMPRGAIHEARAVGDEPSLHITLSTHQKWTWADLLLETVQDAIRSAAATDVALRRTLPLRFTEYVGQTKAENDIDRRKQFDSAIAGAMRRVAKAYPIDAAADAMAAKFMTERLPPPEAVTGGIASTGSKIDLRTKIVATGLSTARLVVGEDGLPQLLHCMQNERAATVDRNCTKLPCTPEEAGAIDFILSAYPRHMAVDDVPLEKEEDRVELVEGLVEMGVIRVKMT